MDNIIKAHIKNKSDYWMVDMSGMHASLIKDYLINNDGIPENGAQKIINNAARTLGYCPNPSSNEDKSVTGIVIGKVQSGKTSNFISLTALAFDNGYNIVVVLGGTKKNLLKQNKERIEEYFENASDVVVLNASEDEEELTESKINNFIDLGKKIIIVTLKHAKRIKDLKNNLFSEETINTQPIMIIDDEGDEYSLNTKYKKNEQSAVFASIKSLLHVCRKRAFISVTATPQANIIVPVLDTLSPDFGILVYPGEGYCGLDVFHGVDSPYCIEISEESSILDNEETPESFHDALAMFFVGAAIYRERTEKNKKYSMLIHPSRMVKDLSYVKKKTEELMEIWRSNAKNPDDIEFEFWKERLKKAFEQYKKDGVEVKSFETLLDSIYDQIKDCGIHLITGEKHLNKKDKNYSNNIYIGGDMLGRGLTIKGLAITYIIRTAKGVSSIDTVQQRARWFGYKEDILDLCRIYATNKILEEYQEIKSHEEDLWMTIEENNYNGVGFKNMKRLFIISDKLRMTRPSIGDTSTYQFLSWNKGTAFIEKEEYQEYNKQIEQKLVDDNYNSIVDNKYGGLAVRDLNFSDVVDKYLSKIHFANKSNVDNSFIVALKKLLTQTNVDAKCDIVWPRSSKRDGKVIQEESVHTIDANGHIPNYMVGENPNYPGDGYIRRGDVIEVQFHNICDRKTRKNSLTIAIYVPENYIGRMSRVVEADV